MNVNLGAIKGFMAGFSLLTILTIASLCPSPVFAFTSSWIEVTNASGIPANYDRFGTATNDTITYLVGGSSTQQRWVTDVYSFNFHGNVFTAETSLPIGLEKPAVVFHDVYLYVFGGSYDNGTIYGGINSTVYRYHTVNKIWTPLGDAPPHSPSKSGYVKQGNLVYFYGGHAFEGLMTFDLSTETWTVVKAVGPRSLSSLWFSAGFTTPDGKVHFHGGRDNSTGTNFNDVVTYDRVTSNFSMTEIPAYGQAKESAKPVMAGQRIYLLGGLYKNGPGFTAVSEVVYYDTQTKAWGSDTSMPFATGNHDVSSYSSSVHRIILFYQHKTYILDSVQTNPLSSWSELTSTPEYPEIYTYSGSGYDPSNGNIYIVGGHDWINNHALKRVYEYNPSTKQFTTLPDLPVGLEEPHVVVIGTNLYVFGGTKSHYINSNRTMYRYDLSAGTSGVWDTLTESSRDIHTAGIAVKGHEIYIYGGPSSEGLMVYNTEVAESPWTDLPVTGPRGSTSLKYSTGFVTSDGKVHFYGGKLSSGEYTNTVVTYDPAQGIWLPETVPAYGTLKGTARVAVVGSKYYFLGGRDGRPGCT